ncbi:MAG: amino acid permease [Desulfobacterales bacterium]|nr:amino acid permease [Desulfobacterales bacterium]
MSQTPARNRNLFSTFGGVFTPAILTILGVIMFMRANFVVGRAGIIGAVIILLIAKSITLTTTLSISAISTNMQVRGGGSYFLISRVLGPEFGGAIGIALFSALALSVPFYILGFTEALVLSFPALAPYFQAITLGTALFLFSLACFGAGWAIRLQYLIMIFLFLAVAVFLGGALVRFSPEVFVRNLSPSYTAPVPDGLAGVRFSFWTIFAIYFPAVTGIDAGLNMSGDLRDPGRSIPRGTLAAVGVGFLVYLAQMILCGGAYPREQLITMPYELLHDNALFGWTILVTLGVVAATLSSALGSYLGAPRVLQAISRDRLLNFLRFFGQGSPGADEPRRALLLTLVITIAVLLWAGNESGGASLNAVAAVITMFFLYSYGMINLAAFTEDFGDNPSFRPRFRFFHWGSALAGAVACLAVSFLINWPTAIVAVLLIAALLWFLKKHHLRATFGDARRGFVFQSVRNNLLKLRSLPEDPKNWRPVILAFSGTPEERETLIYFAVWLEARRGLVYLAHILVGDFAELAPRRPAAVRRLIRFCNDKEIDAFPVVVVADTVEKGVTILLQSTVTGPVYPNLALLGWSKNAGHLSSYATQLRTAAGLGMSLVLLESEQAPDPEKEKRIDIWWRGQKNGDLMMLLAYLLTSNWQWSHSRVRVLRVVENEAGREPARMALEELIDRARVEAAAEILVSRESIVDIVHDRSRDADCVFLGFDIPAPELEREWFRMYGRFVKGMPTVVLVNSRGHEGLLA